MIRLRPYRPTFLLCMGVSIIALIVLLLSPTPAFAEFYKYRDANGVLRFTDNLAEVPQDQRPNVSRYQQVEDFQAPAAQPPEATEANQREKRESESESGRQAAEISARYKELNQKKAALDQEYTELTAAQQALAEERKSANTNSEVTALNQKVQQLNERIAAFEQKRSDFEQEVKAFNEQY